MTGILSLMLMTFLGFYSCKKDATQQKATETFSEQLAADENFIHLNDAINRFDPLYLKIVYHDPRTTMEISKASMVLLQKISENPNNELLIKEFADFYHFRSIEELKENSGKTPVNMQELNRKFNLSDEVLKNNKAKEFVEARIIYARNRYDELTANKKLQPKALSNSNPKHNSWEEYMLEMDMYFHAYLNQSLTDDNESGGIDCKSETCCLQKVLCDNTAQQNLVRNINIHAASVAGGMAIAVGRAGFLYGTALMPGFANLTLGFFGGAIGGLIGGAIGLTYAYNLYHLELESCKTKYEICLAEKK